MSAELRPPQPPTPAADAFELHRAHVADGLSLAFIHEGRGGYPLVLLHGYPETKRIWWRNIEPLVAAGYEVIVPDLRGYGDSDLSADDAYDLTIYSHDIHALVTSLGHDRCGMVAGDVGGAVMIDIANRFPGFVDRQIFFNSIAPLVLDQLDWYAKQGIGLDPLPPGPTGDYRIRQGEFPDELLAELDTPNRRRQWVRDCYEHRLWASPFTFTSAEMDFHTEPFGDAQRLAASWAPYQLSYGRPSTEAPLLAQQCATPTMILYGPDDQVVPKDFAKRCEIAFPNRIGPLVVPECGHFLQWERADVLNPLMAMYFADLLQ